MRLRGRRDVLQVPAGVVCDAKTIGQAFPGVLHAAQGVRMFWRKEKPIPTLKGIQENILTITFRGGDRSWWTESPWEGVERLRPWKKFYRWYFGRTGNDFMLADKTGETLIRRDTIASFDVHIKQRVIL